MGAALGDLHFDHKKGYLILLWVMDFELQETKKRIRPLNRTVTNESYYEDGYEDY
jgi:hypothetical protein